MANPYSNNYGYIIAELKKSSDEMFKDIVFTDNRRYYLEDLSKRDFLLENTTPYTFRLDDYFVEEHAWGNMIINIANHLLEMKPEYLNKIPWFKCEWSKMEGFSKDERTNYKRLDCGVYINCNHTALHACWFIQDILTFFEINLEDVELYIHRPFSAEPKNVASYILTLSKQVFKEYLIEREDLKLSDDGADEIINKIDKLLNPLAASVSKSFTNLFTFDDRNSLYGNMKLIKKSAKFKAFPDEVKNELNFYMDLLFDFYKA